MVDAFSGEQGALFLLHRSGLLALNATLDQAEARSQQLAMEIAHELGGLPLALDQAGAYLIATSSSLAAYKQIYQRRRAQLLAQRRGAEHPEPVAMTWDISFHRVEQQNPAAADLLRLCAFLAPEAIPEELFAKGARELGEVLAPVTSDAYLLDEAIERLRAYSLIARDPQIQTLTVHRLVQAVLRDSIPVEAQQQWMQRAVLAVNAAFPDDIEFENWFICARLLPHAFVCITWIEQVPLAIPKSALLLNQAGYYLHVRGRYGEAELLYRRALAIREQQLGANHLAMATSLNNLSGLYWDQGKYGEAEQLLKSALTIWEQQLGATHLNTATGLNNLAALYYDQGMYAEAEPLFQYVLAIREQQLGAGHPDVVTSLNNLANLYSEQGKYEEAELLYQCALVTCEQELGASHPIMATSLDGLAILYKTKGKYREAEPLYQRALAICEQELGASHPHTATSLNNLATFYYDQEKYTEAELLYQRALAIREQQLGATHPDTMSSFNNLAGLYESQSKYGEAESLLKRALAVCERILGREHPLIQTMSGKYAALLRNMGHNGETRMIEEGS
jgi:tetratricopeptide (TPR) repeat protein